MIIYNSCQSAANYCSFVQPGLNGKVCQYKMQSKLTSPTVQQLLNERDS